MKLRPELIEADEKPRVDRRRAERLALRRLDELYAEAGRVLAARRCGGCGGCCQLARTRREPYLFPVELTRILAALRAAGRALPAARADGACRLLDESGARCSLHPDRPLGCRTFYCEARARGAAVPASRIHQLDARLTRLSDELDPGAHPRELSRLLAEMEASG